MIFACSFGLRSINDTSRDLDQIEVAERVDAGIRVRVGVANVSAWVLKGTPIDEHAVQQTQTAVALADTSARSSTVLSTPLATKAYMCASSG